jgi:hypothetical protein
MLPRAIIISIFGFFIIAAEHATDITQVVTLVIVICVKQGILSLLLLETWLLWGRWE